MLVSTVRGQGLVWAIHIHAVALEGVDAGALGASRRADWERRRTVCSCLVCHILGGRRGWRGRRRRRADLRRVQSRGRDAVLQAIAVVAIGWRGGIALGALGSIRLGGDTATPPLQLVEERGHGRQCCGWGILSALRAWAASVGC